MRLIPPHRPARIGLLCALPRAPVHMFAAACTSVQSPVSCGSAGVLLRVAHVPACPTTTGQPLRRLPRFVPCPHRYTITERAPAQPAVEAAAAIPAVQARAAVRDAQGNVTQPEVVAVPAVPAVVARAAVPADLVPIPGPVFKYLAIDTHYFLAFLDWCDRCRKPGHLTRACLFGPVPVQMPAPPQPPPPQQQQPMHAVPPPPLQPLQQPPAAWPVVGAPPPPPQHDGWVVVGPGGYRRGRGQDDQQGDTAHRARRAE